MHTYKTKQKIIESIGNIKFHDAVIDEIDRLVIGSGNEEQFFRAFIKNIGMIKVLGQKVVELSNFEKLKGTDDLYSMKIKGKNMNLRMLYSYDEKTETIMLHFFYERDDSKKDSYSSHIPIAEERKREMEAR